MAENKRLDAGATPFNPSGRVGLQHTLPPHLQQNIPPPAETTAESVAASVLGDLEGGGGMWGGTPVANITKQQQQDQSTRNLNSSSPPTTNPPPPPSSLLPAGVSSSSASTTSPGSTSASVHHNHHQPPPAPLAPAFLPAATTGMVQTIISPKRPRFFMSGTISCAAWNHTAAAELEDEYPGAEFDVHKPKVGKTASITVMATSQVMLRGVVSALKAKVGDAISLDQEIYREEVTTVTEPMQMIPQQMQVPMQHQQMHFQQEGQGQPTHQQQQQQQQPQLIAQQQQLPMAFATQPLLLGAAGGQMITSGFVSPHSITSPTSSQGQRSFHPSPAPDASGYAGGYAGSYGTAGGVISPLPAGEMGGPQFSGEDVGGSAPQHPTAGNGGAGFGSGNGPPENQTLAEACQQDPKILAMVDPSNTGYLNVMDPLSARIPIPLHSIFQTQGIFRAGTPPAVCMLFLKNRCRQGSNCFQIHADRDVIQALRTVAQQELKCCSAHGDEAIMLARYVTKYMILFSEGGSGNAIPLQRLSMTSGLQRLLADFEGQQDAEGKSPSDLNCNDPAAGVICLRPPTKNICRLHGTNRCKFGSECRFLHVCKELIWDEVKDGQRAGGGGGSSGGGDRHTRGVQNRQ